MAHVGSFSHFVFVIVFVFVFACVFVIVITGASVDRTCHELSKYVWLYVCEASEVNNWTILFSLRPKRSQQEEEQEQQLCLF